MAKHFSWTHIDAFHQIRRAVNKYSWTQEETYRAKIKLHGTNAGVMITPDGEVYAQTRKRIITPDNDHMGFAKWVEEHAEYFSRLNGSEDTIVVYGEWCGKGIQNGVSICQTPKKQLAVFAIRTIAADAVIYDPGQINFILGTEQILLLNEDKEKVTVYPPKDNRPDNIYVLPWYGEEHYVDFTSGDSLVEFSQALNQMVEEVEKEDPWVKETFGIEGTGEGIVCYPLNTPNYEQFSQLIFKAKGEKHKQVTKVTKPVQIDPVVAESTQDFVDAYVTENRMLQAVTEACEGEYDIRHTGKFLKWMGNDVQREGAETLEDSGLDWKMVAKHCNSAAATWYKRQVKEKGLI